MPRSVQLMTVEEQLLILLCRLEFTEKQKARTAELIKEVKEWDYFLNLANGHGVIALCWFNITSAGNDKFVPVKYLELLHSGYYKSLTRNIFLKNLLEEISGLAAKEDIKIVALKGNSLEEMVYGNMGLRQMSDIDILVEMDKAIPLRSILLKNGFNSVPVISPLHKSILPYLKAHMPPMEKNGAFVEIHVKLFDQKENSLTEDLLENSYKPYEHLSNLYWPRPRQFFLYLVKHIFNHESSKDLKLKSYLDLAVLLSFFRDKIIDENLTAEAQRAGLGTALLEKLKIMEIFWNFSFPEWIKEKTKLIDQEKISERFIWLVKNPVQDDPENRTPDLAKPFRNIPGKLNKVIFVIGYVFPSLTFMEYFYKTGSKSKALFYYPVRWWRLLRLAGGEKGIKV